MPELRYGQAINAALREELQRDPTVYLFGEDVAGAGGVFGITRGLQKEFGPQRVRDTPISEAGIVGLAVGAALAGLRPVVEIMFMDFLALAMDQIVNQAAKIHYMFGGQRPVPLVVRTQCGGGLSAGPQHSQCLEAWFAHVPGLKVVTPATAGDAKGLLKSAIRDDNPVIFVEHKALYAAKGDVPEGEYTIPLGEAVIRRTGRDVTIVALSRMVVEALKAADELATRGVEAEVIDLRCVSPLDHAPVLASVQRTGRLVVAHEAVVTAGIGAEIAARIADLGHASLKAPIKRVGALGVPIPFAPQLERAVLPDARRITAACEAVLGS